MRCVYGAKRRAVRQLFAMGGILRALFSNTIRFALNPHLACPLPAQERAASLPVSQNAAESAPADLWVVEAAWPVELTGHGSHDTFGPHSLAGSPANGRRFSRLV